MATGERRAARCHAQAGLLVAGLVAHVDCGTGRGRGVGPWPIALLTYYSEIARQLQGTYEEAPVSLGLQSNGNLLQVFSSADSGSWTIVSTSPDGLACVLAAGSTGKSVKPARLDPAA